MPAVFSKYSLNPRDDKTKSGSQTSRNRQPPPIPLMVPEETKKEKGEFLKLDLRSDPTNEDSETYSFSIKFFNFGTAEEWLKWTRDFNKIVRGQGLTTGVARFAMARNILLGEALRVFESKASTQATESVANFTECLNAVTAHHLPQKALIRQKRYLRRDVKKPREMNIRQFTARINEINEYLAFFPPFEADSKMPEDEILDILETAIPSSWQTQMMLQGFDFMEHDLNEFIEFCERLETAERIYSGNGKSKGAGAQTQLDAGNKKIAAKRQARYPDKDHKPTKRSRTEKYCELHNTNTHDTGECKVLLAQAQKMRSAYKTHDSRYDNRNLKRKNDNGTSKTEQLNAMITKLVDERIATNNKNNKTRKISGESDSDKEANFNLENLSLETSRSDDEGSV